MALPKEPRQKMINMMYLVLTALLALNVSAEIINAFVTVENSLTKSNNTLTLASGQVYEGLQASLEDPKTRDKAAIWKPKAEQVKALSDKIAVYIESLKERMKKTSGYEPGQSDSTGWYNNLESPTRIMDTEGEGEKLRSALEQYKKDILAIDPDIAKEFAKNLPINTEPPKSSTGSTSQTWSASYFHMTPTIAAVTILSKFQNDVKNTENKVASFCLKQIGAVKVIYDKFEPLVGTNSTYLMPGEQMEVKAGLGAFNAAVKPTVTIDGRPVTVNDNGVAETKFNVGGSGSRKMHVVVKYVDPNTGETKTLEKDIAYTVGMPAGVAVSPDKMNVLYIGVENPLTITAGAGSEKVSAQFTGGPISKISGNKYVAKPSPGSTGDHTVTVLVEGKAVGKVGFRVKKLPNPAAYVGNLKPGAVQSAQFKAMGGVITKLEDSEFDYPFEVLSYNIGIVSPDNPDYVPVAINGPRWTSAQAQVNKLRPGALVVITDIRVKGPEGARTLSGSLSYSLK
jgi:gliding motility-associated protein GldM